MWGRHRIRLSAKNKSEGGGCDEEGEAPTSKKRKELKELRLLTAHRR